jgi:hypothetical protein
MNTSAFYSGNTLPDEFHKFEYATLIGRVTKTMISGDGYLPETASGPYFFAS